MLERNIGIVGDGATDIAIFRKISECILSDGEQNNVTLNYIELRRQTIHDAVEKYCREANKITDGCYLTGKQALDFKNSVTNTLYGAFADFESELELISNRDIILLTADSEHTFSNPDDYFKDWRFSISKILVGSIEEFYRAKAREGYTHEYLPVVIPIVVFPSTEIFIAAAKIDTQKLIKEAYGKKPRELKQLLYGTTELQTLSDEEFNKKALDFINSESIGRIFQSVPESRTFIQTLSLGKYSI
ncbi:hypothetical protein H6G06_19830 [Anabaena sphaerica FACHB-251]|uniref:Uncharacterized protein n=1 Tax=Anabaena sphaerica FACHB-251 TaxID=2692883 RepID=A0A926WM42_9NOST|nr:hypothetical protein [Anabaena sphaerica]MBD2295663.1 hypothetical protein [Anabaena sphaerica FACHB-251]